jgi:hypothetical protein
LDGDGKRSGVALESGCYGMCIVSHAYPIDTIPGPSRYYPNTLHFTVILKHNGAIKEKRAVLKLPSLQEVNSKNEIIRLFNSRKNQTN